MSKYIFAAAILILIFSVLTMVTNHQGFSIKAITFSYWAFLSGSIVYFIESYENK